MSCFHPLKAERLGSGEIVFYSTSAGSKWTGAGEFLELPCGQCIGCRIERARQWSMRIVHEAQLHDNNCFITLTYNPENLPPDCGLRKKHYQDFMHRFRKSIKPTKVKFFMCGEYGDKSNRPHYHAIIFGYNFDDWHYLFDSPSGEEIYTSPKLEKIWGKGFVTVGTVNINSANYVSRYVLKKITGKGQDKIDENTGLKPYERFNSFTGEITPVLPEYSSMSRGGRHGRGLAHDWIVKYTTDVYPKDYTTIDGVRMSSSRYYDTYLEQLDLDMYDQIKQGRIMLASLSSDNSESRLSQKEKCQEARQSKLIRCL